MKRTPMQEMAAQANWALFQLEGAKSSLRATQNAILRSAVTTGLPFPVEDIAEKLDANIKHLRAQIAARTLHRHCQTCTKGCKTVPGADQGTIVHDVRCPRGIELARQMMEGAP